MNKRNRVAAHKHRATRKKLKEKRRREKALAGQPAGSGGRGEAGT